MFSGASSLVQYELSEQEYASRQVRLPLSWSLPPCATVTLAQTFDLFANEFLQRLDDLVTPFKVGPLASFLRWFTPSSLPYSLRRLVCPLNCTCRL